MTGPINPFKKKYEILRKKGQTILQNRLPPSQGYGGLGRLNVRSIASPKT